MYHIYADGRSIYNPLLDDLVLLEPRCILEMGKAGSLEFRIPTSNKYYRQLTELSTIILVQDDDENIFRGRILSKEKDFNNTLTIYCEGDLSFLVDSVQKNEAYVGTARNFFSRIIERHNSMVDESKQFRVGLVTIEDRQVIISGQSDVIKDLETDKFNYKQIAINSTTGEWSNTYDYIQNNLIAYCGGYLRTRYINGVSYIDWLPSNFGTASQAIEFGVNLLDLTENLNAENVYTVLIPLGSENLTLEPLTGSPELVDTELVAKYGRIVRTHVFESVTDPQTLLENATRFMDLEMKVPMTVNVKAVDMHMLNENTQAIRLGDLVRIRSTPHDITKELTCTQIEYDFERPENTSYTFGDPEQSLTQRYKKNKEAQTAATAAAAAGAAGGGGGKSDENTENELKEFYDAWIKKDPNHTWIDMGTIYERLEHAITVLHVEAGIDIDAGSGNINIKTLRQEFDENEQMVLNQLSRISTNQDEDKAQIELITSRVNKNSEDIAGHYATFLLTATDLEGRIDAKADTIALQSVIQNVNELDEQSGKVIKGLEQSGIYINGEGNNVNIQSLYDTVRGNTETLTRHTADITTLANAHTAQVDIVAAIRDRVTGAEQSIAQIVVKADRNSSRIDLIADEITLGGNVTIKGKFTLVDTAIQNLETDVASVRRLVADEISAVTGNVDWMHGKSIQTGTVQATSITATNTILVGGNEVATKDWCGNQYYTKSQIDYILRRSSGTTGQLTLPYSALTGVPSSFTPANHSHSLSLSVKSASVSKSVTPTTVLPHTHDSVSVKISGSVGNVK